MGNVSAEPTARGHMIACEEFGDACLELLVSQPFYFNLISHPPVMH